MSDLPSKALQIDSLLTDQLYKVVERYCGGAWGLLPDVWTVTLEEIVLEAKRRSLECYISGMRPGFEGYKIGEASEGFEVYYYERGTKSAIVKLPDLESAFRCWLDSKLRENRLA